MATDWSTMPSDPLGAIAMKFDVFKDFIRFSAVCKEWNRASSLVEHQWRAPLPSLLLAENTKENPDCLRKIFNLNNKQTYQLKLPETFGARCWGSAYGWVAMVCPNRSVQLFNPITKAKIDFPSFKSLEHYPIPEDDYYDDDHLFCRVYLIKLIVLKVPRNGRHEFVIMVIYSWERHLAFARQGDQSWTSVLTKEFKFHVSRRVVTKMVDVVSKNDDIFALYGDGAIVHWNSKEFQSGKPLEPTDYYSPPWPPLEMFLRLTYCQRTIYLIVSRGDLIMVIRHKKEIAMKDYPEQVDYDIDYRTIDFDVFKFNEHDGWEKIEDLGNVALFIGGNYSMSITLGAVQSLEHTGIYFTDDEYEFWSMQKEFGGHDMGFYDMKHRDIQFDKGGEIRSYMACRDIQFLKGDDIRSLFTRRDIQFHKGDDIRSLFCPATWFIPEL